LREEAMKTPRFTDPIEFHLPEKVSGGVRRKIGGGKREL